MAILDDRVKTFIVQALACFDSPTQVSAAVKDEFGIVVERMQVQQYNPTRVAAGRLGQKWVNLFHVTRKKFLEETASIPIAQQSYRLRQLQRLADDAVAKKNAPLAAQLLEQAAKEVGGAFTNRREHSGPNGAPIPVKGEVVHTMSDADLATIAAQGLPATAKPAG